jgi:hypothetical protein
MAEAPGSPSGPVTAADVEHAVRLAVIALRGADTQDWSAKAGSLEWDCWETVEHLADGLFSYAVQLGPEKPPLDTHVPFAWSRKKPGGPANAIFADRDAGWAGLLQVLEASGALLTAIVRTTPPTVRSHHAPARLCLGRRWSGWEPTTLATNPPALANGAPSIPESERPRRRHVSKPRAWFSSHAPGAYPRGRASAAAAPSGPKAGARAQPEPGSAPGEAERSRVS